MVSKAEYQRQLRLALAAVTSSAALKMATVAAQTQLANAGRQTEVNSYYSEGVLS